MLSKRQETSQSARQLASGELEALTGDVRRLFHLLKALGNAVHADLAITASMRGVLESLVNGGPSTVPQMARARPVSRQHIQVIVDELLKAGLVALEPNPAHKRSPFVKITREGQKAFAAMARRESQLFTQLGGGFSERELASARRVLRRLADELAAALEKLAGKDEGATHE